MADLGIEQLLRDRNLPHGLPNDAAPVNGQNGTAITSTATQTILAAPGAGKVHYITSITISQPTSAETPEITVEDTGGEFFKATLGQETKTFTFDPPLKTPTANSVIRGHAGSSVGDTTVTVNGYTGSE